MGEGSIMATGALVAFTALSAGASIYQGFQANAAYKEQSAMLMQQAQIAQRENALSIRQQQREIDKVAARQVMAMSKNGLVTSAGSPLEVLYETAELGAQEVEALKLQGQAQVYKYTTEAQTAKNNGRTSLIGGFSNAASTVLSTYAIGSANGVWGSKTTKTTKSTGSLTGFTPSINSTGYTGTLPKI